jgi:hypothetical protein
MLRYAAPLRPHVCACHRRYSVHARKEGGRFMDNIVTSETPCQFQPERKRSYLPDHLRIVVTAPSMANIHSLNPAWSGERFYRATINGDRVQISNRLL